VAAEITSHRTDHDFQPCYVDDVRLHCAPPLFQVTCLKDHDFNKNSPIPQAVNMGLVDYSESSDSEPEAPAKLPPKLPPKLMQTNTKKTFQKVVDRSNPGKILVSLPSLASEGPKASTSSDEPPAKRAKSNGGSLFGGFNSFLPPPKNGSRPAVISSSKPGSAPRPGINLKTGAAPGFSREREIGGDGEASAPFSGDGNMHGGGLVLPPPKASAQPEIPSELKPAEEVKLVGKPLMFKPLSVARKPGKKNGVKSSVAKALEPTLQVQNPASNPAVMKAPPPKKISLFGISDGTTEEVADSIPNGGAYEPLFTAEDSDPNAADTEMTSYLQTSSTIPLPLHTPTNQESLDSIANELNLSPTARRELFGRGRKPTQPGARVVNFDVDREYRHNEEIRAAGEEQTHNPVRAIQPGKHSLRQLVNQVQNQREALEESFAKGKTNRKEASGRYGW
jgi:hypothetical protein